MKIIRKRLVLLIYLCSVGLLLSSILYVNSFVIFRIDMLGFFTLLFLTSGLLIILLMREFEVYRIAKLIIENKIMHIEAAEINQESDDLRSKILRIEVLEVYISCFGILLGSRVIKFNIDGINLKKVEIGNDFISLVYGTNKKNQIIKLIHGVIRGQDLLDIIERFRYETGITPIVVD